MFALLFDRKSGLLTLLAVGAIGVLLFAAGLVVGVNLSWEKLASHLPQTANAAVPPVSSLAPTAASVSARARPRALLGTPAEPASFSRRDSSVSSSSSPSSSPPAGWVPLTDGAPWPGAAGERGDDSRRRHRGPRRGCRRRPRPARATSSRRERSPTRPAPRRCGSACGRCRGKRYQPFVESVWDRYGRRLVAVRIGPFPDEVTAQEVSTGLNGSLVGRSSGHRT